MTPRLRQNPGQQWAKAGIHPSPPGSVGEWTPAFAGPLHKALVEWKRAGWGECRGTVKVSRYWFGAIGRRLRRQLADRRSAARARFQPVSVRSTPVALRARLM